MFPTKKGKETVTELLDQKHCMYNVYTNFYHDCGRKDLAWKRSSHTSLPVNQGY